MPELKQRMKRHFFIAAGTVSVGLGIIGIIVPVLPTTPFLLLGAACYIRVAAQDIPAHHLIELHAIITSALLTQMHMR